LLINLLSPHPEAPARPSTPEVLRARECTPTPSPSVVFTFGLVFESIEELGGVSSKNMTTLISCCVSFGFVGIP
jgi:hypothetical protein